MTNLKKKPAVKLFIILISIIAFFILAVLIWYGKGRLEQQTAPWRAKVPKNQAELGKLTEDVLGEAVKSATEGGFRKAVDKGSEFFEGSEFTQPARGIRDEAKSKLDEIFDKIKALPAEELKIIKNKIYQDWIKQDINGS